MANFTDKLSLQIGKQVPQFVLQDHPVFVDFLKTYFAFMESAELVLNAVETTDGVQLESLTNLQNELLLDGSSLQGTNTILDQGDKILLESSIYGKFINGETIIGQTSNAISTVLVEDLNANSRLFIAAQDKFETGETIIGLTSNASAIITSYRPNPVINIQQLLNFRDPDKVIDRFLTQFKKEFLNLLPDTLYSGVDIRTLIKNAKFLYGLKGTAEGNHLFFRLLFDETAQTIYPREQLLRISDGKWNTNTIIRTINATDEVSNLIGRTITGSISGATAIIENVLKFNINQYVVNEITLNAETIQGDFLVGETIFGTTNDIDLVYIQSTITGIPTQKNITNAGALYKEKDFIDVIGGGLGASAQIKTVGSDSISEIIIQNGGSGYQIGDQLIFNNSGTYGGGASGFVAITNGSFLQDSNDSGDDGTPLLLEDATTSQDNYSGNNIVQERATGINDITKIFLTNGGGGYKSLPLISFNTIAGRNANVIGYGTNIGSVKEVQIIDSGIAYETAPTPPTLSFKQNLLLKNIAGTFVAGETVTCNLDGISGTVVSYNSSSKILILKNVINKIYSNFLNLLWNSTTTYNVNDIVTVYYPVSNDTRNYYAIQFQCQVSNSNQNPLTTTGYWAVHTSIYQIEFDFKDAISIYGSISNASADIAFINVATGNLNVGAMATTDGRYLNQDGFLDESTKVIQDDLVYQDFSYIIKIGRSINEWRDAFKRSLHTAGFYLSAQVGIESLLSAKIKPVKGLISNEIKYPLFNILNTLYTTVFGRRLGTSTDGTTKNPYPLLGVTTYLNNQLGTVPAFARGTRELTLSKQPLLITYTSRPRNIIGSNNVASGYAYAGPSFNAINKFPFSVYSNAKTTIGELSKNFVFNTRTALDNTENTFLLCSTYTGKTIKTKLTIPTDIQIIFSQRRFDNTAMTFDSTVDAHDATPVTFDQTIS